MPAPPGLWRSTFFGFPIVRAPSPEQRAAHHRTTGALFGAVEAVEELPDGFAFRVPSSADLLKASAEFIDLERRCCP